MKVSILVLFKLVYNLSILMADAAASITIGFTVVFGSNFTRLMCYCHVERACVRRLNGNEDKDTIIFYNLFIWLFQNH